MLQRWPRLARRLYLAGWWSVAPTLLIVLFMLYMTGHTNASQVPTQPRVMLTKVLFQEQQPLCQNCHPTEYAAWKGTPHAKATLDPVFKDQLAKVNNPAACLTCHTTGFDTGTGQFLTEGVSCEACHGSYKEGHPKGATMQLPMKSDTCNVCHEATFKEWEHSAHAGQNIECFDCHMAHTQGLRTGSEQKLCGACHSERQTQMAHATHGINGVDCATCHMSQHSASYGSGMETSARDHSFKVSADVCAGCHSSTIHTSNNLTSLRQTAQQLDPDQLLQKASEVPALERQVSDLQQQVAMVRNFGTIGSGLALGGGGFLGLVLGIAGMSLWRRRS
jgi:hypothetical protein